jgi:putative transposase
MVGHIDQHRDEFGVAPICRTLQIAPASYDAAKTRPASARAQRDAVMLPMVLMHWNENNQVYRVRKMCKALDRAGVPIGRDQVGRLMRILEIRGVAATKKWRSTISDPTSDRHPDLFDRGFTADAPNRLWVTDLTIVPTWQGAAYICFITDAFSRMIVGWRVAGHMRTTMVLDALKMARWDLGTQLDGLVCHSDAGSQAGFKRSSQHLDSLRRAACRDLRCTLDRIGRRQL